MNRNQFFKKFGKFLSIKICDNFWRRIWPIHWKSHYCWKLRNEKFFWTFFTPAIAIDFSKLNIWKVIGRSSKDRAETDRFRMSNCLEMNQPITFTIAYAGFQIDARKVSLSTNHNQSFKISTNNEESSEHYFENQPQFDPIKGWLETPDRAEVLR